MQLVKYEPTINSAILKQVAKELNNMAVQLVSYDREQKLEYFGTQDIQTAKVLLSSGIELEIKIDSRKVNI